MKLVCWLQSCDTCWQHLLSTYFLSVNLMGFASVILYNSHRYHPPHLIDVRILIMSIRAGSLLHQALAKRSWEPEVIRKMSLLLQKVSFLTRGRMGDRWWPHRKTRREQRRTWDIRHQRFRGSCLVDLAFKVKSLERWGAGILEEDVLWT